MLLVSFEGRPVGAPARPGVNGCPRLPALSFVRPFRFLPVFFGGLVLAGLMLGGLFVLFLGLIASP